MRRPAEYPKMGHTDRRDRRMASIIRRAPSAKPGAVNILGVPYDGAVLGRKGAAEGPSGIRQAMRFFSNYDPELGLDLLRARVVDIGDVILGSDDVLKVHARVAEEVSRALVEGSLLVVLGGDNSISLPSISACAKKFGKIGLIVLDSHFDLRRPMSGKPTSGSSYGTALRTLPELAPDRTVEIGIHGFLNSRAYAEEAERMGLTVYTADDVRNLGAAKVVRESYALASNGADAVYVSVDMDCVDLAYVSGVSAPSVGGLDPSELFQMARYLGSRPTVVCADVVELAPPLDLTWRSQVTASTTLMHLVAGFSTRETSK